MTQAQATELARGIARAEAEHIQIAGRGYRLSDKAPVFAVTSSADPSVCYLVALEADGHLHCQCKAGQRGRICKHRSTVYVALRAGAEQFRAFDERESALLAELHTAAAKLHAAIEQSHDASLAPAAPAETSQDVAAALAHAHIAVAEMEATIDKAGPLSRRPLPDVRPMTDDDDELTVRRETAPLYRDNAPISIWK
jgi:hypothetical protein